MKAIVKLTKIAQMVGLIALVAMCFGLNSLKAAEQTGKINVISREDGSGTRGAFVEIFGLLEKKGDKKVDTTTLKAEITNSTAVMLQSIAKDKNAIGYVSLGSLKPMVKGVQIDGVEPSVANIKIKKYTISRPFNVVTKGLSGEKLALVRDFLDFSKANAEVISKAGYIPLDVKKVASKKLSGKIQNAKIVVAGSSSITPLMEKLKEAYKAQNPSVNIEILQSDSTTGINSVLQGIADIGMVSRELKESELSTGLKAEVLAIDGLAVIVNPQSKITSLSKEQVKEIFSGKVTKWEEVK
ncbi:substrate-binding domain-containing protein [Helicobacter sp. 23-1046]